MIIKEKYFNLTELDADALTLGAIKTYDKICRNEERGRQFLEELEELFPNGIFLCDLEDLLGTYPETCYKLAGLDENGNEPNDDEEDEEDEEK